MTISIVKQFNEYINNFHLAKKNDIIAIAVSGGADSLALTFLADQWAKKKKVRVIGLTVNHNLRTEALNEAHSVSALLSKHGIEHHILHWKHKEKISSNIQARARKARLELMTNWCKEHNINILLTAHTKNDVVETFFMNIFRGSGVYGLASIPSKTTYNDVQIIRPVSAFTKEELKSHLRKLQIKWFEDPSNQDTKFLRVKVRKLLASNYMQDIFPDENLMLDRVLTNVNNMLRVKGYLEAMTTRAMEEMVTIHPEGYITIDRNKFINTELEIALNLLSSCLITVSGEHEYRPRLDSLKILYNHICSNKFTTKTLWGCKVTPSKDNLHICKEIGKNKKAPKEKNLEP